MVFGDEDEGICFRLDMDKDRVRIKLWMPHLELTSNYSMDGRILMMPITGQGTGKGNYSKIFNAHQTTKAKPLFCR